LALPVAKQVSVLSSHILSITKTKELALMEVYFKPESYSKAAKIDFRFLASDNL
jgi:hypothetical protein